MMERILRAIPQRPCSGGMEHDHSSGPLWAIEKELRQHEKDMELLERVTEP